MRSECQQTFFEEMRYCKEDILILTVVKYIVSGFFFSVSGKSF